MTERYNPALWYGSMVFIILPVFGIVFSFINHLLVRLVHKMNDSRLGRLTVLLAVVCVQLGFSCTFTCMAGYLFGFSLDSVRLCYLLMLGPMMIWWIPAFDSPRLQKFQRRMSYAMAVVIAVGLPAGLYQIHQSVQQGKPFAASSPGFHIRDSVRAAVPIAKQFDCGRIKGDRVERERCEKKIDPIYQMLLDVDQNEAAVLAAKTGKLPDGVRRGASGGDDVALGPQHAGGR